MLRESSYADLTVRAVAARAKVAPATAYTYFSSKNHLIAEVYLDLMRQVPYFTDVNDSQAEPRREDAAQHGADGRRRARGGRRLHDRSAERQRPTRCARCATASAPRSTAASVRPSARTPTRARLRAGDDVLRRAGQRRQRRLHLPPDRRPPQLRGRPHLGRRPMTVDTSDRLLDPYDYDFHEDPYPYYKRLRDEAPLYHNEELSFWALSRHQDVLQGFRNSTTLSNQRRRVARSRSRADRTPSKTMSFLAHGRSRPSAAAHPGLQGLHAAANPRAGAAGHRDRRRSISTRCWRRPDRRNRRLRRRIRGQAADGRHLRADGRARRGPRPHPGAGRRGHAPRRRRHRRARRSDRGVDQPDRLLPGDGRRSAARSSPTT